ncbi:MAG: type II toxin-antitoxin system VapC family toxin [Victivallales bacterium]
MDKIVVDTCVFISIFRGDQVLFDTVNKYRVYVPSLVVMELLQGARDKAELRKTEKFLCNYETIQITEYSSLQAIELIKNYSKSHGLAIPDAIIASVAMERKLPLHTLNVKDFSFISGLRLL